MKLDLRVLDIVFHVIASVGLGNAIGVMIFNAKTLVPPEYFGPVTIASTAWVIAAFIIKKSVIA